MWNHSFSSECVVIGEFIRAGAKIEREREWPLSDCGIQRKLEFGSVRWSGGALEFPLDSGVKMGRIGVMVMAVLVLYSSAGFTAQVSADCAIVAAPLTACVPFTVGQVTKPSVGCCTALEVVSTTKPECLCEVIGSVSNGANSIPGFNVTLARTLPSLCSVDVSPSQCTGAANGIAPSTAPAAVPVAAPVAAPGAVPAAVPSTAPSASLTALAPGPASKKSSATTTSVGVMAFGIVAATLSYFALEL